MCSVLLLLSLATSERSSHLGCSLKVVLKSFAKLAGTYRCRSRPETLLRKRLWHRYFPVIFTEFSQNTFFKEHFWVPVLLFLLESPVFWVFLSSNLPSVYLLVLWFTLHLVLFKVSSDNDHTKSFDSYKVCTLCLLIE